MIHAVVGLLLAGGLCVSAAAQECAPDRVAVQGDRGEALFRVEIADDPQERAQGLMFVERMPMMEGMLFIYERPHAPSFWMRNTLIPLDMLFIGPDGVIRHIHENAEPLDETPIPGGDGILAVLEINGGMAARLGLKVGDALRHPAFGADAALPCN